MPTMNFDAYLPPRSAPRSNPRGHGRAGPPANPRRRPSRRPADVGHAGRPDACARRDPRRLDQHRDRHRQPLHPPAAARPSQSAVQVLDLPDQRPLPRRRSRRRTPTHPRDLRPGPLALPPGRSPARRRHPDPGLRTGPRRHVLPRHLRRRHRRRGPHRSRWSSPRSIPICPTPSAPPSSSARKSTGWSRSRARSSNCAVPNQDPWSARSPHPSPNSSPTEPPSSSESAACPRPSWACSASAEISASTPD